jgi:predicted nucleic acid-binding protein
MGRLIDTSIFIDAERGRLDLDRFIADSAEEQFFMSVITVSELLYGVHRATPKYRRQRSDAIETWIDRFTIIDIDLPISREHSRISSELSSAGLLVGIHDQWLAATSVARDLVMVTANVSKFIRVPRLVVENWTVSE